MYDIYRYVWYVTVCYVIVYVCYVMVCYDIVVYGISRFVWSISITIGIGLSVIWLV